MIWTIFILSLGLALAREVIVPENEEEARDAFIAPKSREDLARSLANENEDEANLVRSPEADENRKGHLYTRISHLGDIALTDEQERQGIKFEGGNSRYKWPEGKVYYYIADYHYSQNAIDKIFAAVKDFNRRLREGGAKLRLVYSNSAKDIIKVVNDNGCWSYVGRIGGEQMLSLQESGCIGQSTIQHEFMHAIGFTHEQNRHDRDNFVEVLWGNIPSDWHSQYQKTDDSFKDMETYDHYSIMHYPWWAPDSGGKDAFRIKINGINKEGLGNGENNGATRNDIKKMRSSYS